MEMIGTRSELASPRKRFQKRTRDTDRFASSPWLDVGEFLAAFSYAYDWLYDAWTPQQRESIMLSIISLGLKKGLEAHDSNAWFLSVRGNWNFK
jgi:hypothetical protein